MARTWVEVEPGHFVWREPNPTAWAKKSTLPMPYVISDWMPPTEQVDGKYYTSKSAFRAVGKALGLTEVGTERLGPKRRSTDASHVKHARRQALREAVERHRSGQRPRPRVTD